MATFFDRDGGPLHIAGLSSGLMLQNPSQAREAGGSYLRLHGCRDTSQVQ